MEGTRRIYSMLSALILAVLTVSVFWTSQSAGPQTAVVKFFAAIRNQSNRDLQAVLAQPLGTSQAAQILVDEAMAIERAGGRVELVRTSPLPGGRAVLVEVIYRAQGYQPLNRIYLVARTPRGWKIDADTSLQLLAMPGGSG